MHIFALEEQLRHTTGVLGPTPVQSLPYLGQHGADILCLAHEGRAGVVYNAMHAKKSALDWELLHDRDSELSVLVPRELFHAFLRLSQHDHFAWKNYDIARLFASLVVAAICMAFLWPLR